MNIWGMGITWYKDSSRQGIKDMKEWFFDLGKAGIGYPLDDPHGKNAWKNLRDVRKGDVIYVKNKDDKGKLQIIRLGIVIKEIGTQLDKPLAELQNGYGIDVKWINSGPIPTEEGYICGAFYQENRERVIRKVIERIAKWAIDEVIEPKELIK